MSPTQAAQLGAVGTKSGSLGPSEDLQGPQKVHFGPKRALVPVQPARFARRLDKKAAHKGSDFGHKKPTEILLPPLAEGQANLHPPLAKGQAKLCQVPKWSARVSK